MGPSKLGKHRLLKRVAVGGTAEVYLAVAEGLSGFAKRVVLKRLLPELRGDADALAMFLDEARLMALLGHEHVVEVYDIDRDGEDYFFTMEHVAGHDLREVLRACRPLPLTAAVAITAAVARGLHHAHERRGPDGEPLGIVHRDVSPSNVLLGWDGTVKLTDFGVAKWSAQRSRTEHGTLKGKLAYMSPEQCRAEPLDRRSDVFALGVLLYELTTGVRPFEGESEFEVLRAITAGNLRPPSAHVPDYPPELEQVVMRALRASPDDRFVSAAALEQALPPTVNAAEHVRALLGQAFPAGAEPEPEVPPPTQTPVAAGATLTAFQARRRVPRAVIVGGPALALVALLWVSLARGRPETPPPAPVSAARSQVAPVRLPAPVVVAPTPAPQPKPLPKRTKPRRPEPRKAWDPDSPVLP